MHKCMNDLVQALAREVAEETGLVVEPLRLVGLYTSPEEHNYTYPNGDRVQPVVAFFEARVLGGTLRAVPDETLELAYFPPDRLPPMLRCCQVKARDAMASRAAAFYR